MRDMTEEVENLIVKACKADKSEDALRFSQAGCNAANAMCSAKSASQISASRKTHQTSALADRTGEADKQPRNELAKLLLVLVEKTAISHPLAFVDVDLTRAIQQADMSADADMR